MYYHAEWIQYVQQLQAYLQAQNMKMEEMNRTIQKLVGEVSELKEKNAQPPVIRNEYKFDLLKVEKLEGTLNIGLSPHAKESSIEEFAVDQAMDVPDGAQQPGVQQPGAQQQSCVYPNIQAKVFDYLDNGAFETLKRIENEHHYPLDDPYRKFIVDDVKRQINQRIDHYMKKTAVNERNPDQIEEVEKAIVQKVKKDIDKTFEAFIKNLPRKENKS